MVAGTILIQLQRLLVERPFASLRLYLIQIRQLSLLLQLSHLVITLRPQEDRRLASSRMN